MIIDCSTISIEFVFGREDVFASWSETYYLSSRSIDELDDLQDYMKELCNIK
jgi:hypothetical protein